MKKIRILLVDDHTVVRQGLRALLGTEADLEVVGEAADGRQAVHMARQLCPEVVVMDLSMPRLNGFEATRQIAKALPSARILVLSSYDDERSVLQLLQAGAAGYLQKQTAADELIEGIRQVHQNQKFFSPAIARRLADRAQKAFYRGDSAARGAEPTPRETEVLQLVAEGFSNKQIAYELGISIKTVEKHRQALMCKLNIHDTAGLTRYAISRSLVQPLMPVLAVASAPS